MQDYLFDFPVETVTEGSAEIVVPKVELFRTVAGDYAPSKAPVFYNPLMKTNRDLAILALQAYQKRIGKELTVSEPLAGCGVRGIRFAKEVTGLCGIYLNDIKPEAAKMEQCNINLNKLTDRVSVKNMDANLFLNENAAPQKRFSFVDIDPFGSPVTYVDSAVRATRDGGLLALTATDMATLCGVYVRAALRKYGGFSLKTEYCHEIAVRLLIGFLASTAARHDVGIEVSFSHSTDHYIRIYALVSHGAKKADESLRKMGYILHCFQCLHRETVASMVPPLKERCACGAKLRTAGPLWIGKISDKGFCEEMRKSAIGRNNEMTRKAIKILSSVRTESDEPATYYVVDKICEKLKLPVPSLNKVIEKLGENGFRASPTHFHNRGFKTDASSRAVMENIVEVFE